MACFHPAKCWPAKPPAKGIVFQSQKSYVGAVPMQIPCGQCIGCRQAKAQDWGTRIAHEASLHASNCFITLTYSDEFYPDSGCVSVREMQLFMKRLRFKLGSKIRFFLGAEYGETTWRAHYHVILFGCDFASDRKPWRKTPNGHLVYRSETLEELWPFGHCEVGTVTPQSGAYVARYCLKKITGEDRARAHYARAHPVTGELVQLVPEFALMSRRPGLGSGWFDKFKCDVYPSDFLIQDGSKVPVPAFYVRKLAEAEKFRLSAKRRQKSWRHRDNNTPERLAVREEVSLLRQKQILREPQ